MPRVPTALVGAPGTVAGVTAADTLDDTLSPTAFVATTVNVYAVPFVKPLTTIGLDAPLAVAPPGDAVTVYETIADPPSLDGASNATDTD